LACPSLGHCAEMSQKKYQHAVVEFAESHGGFIILNGR
jgi:hypothetical protein